MDERIHRHAETLVDWSARIEANDDVVVSVGEGAHDLGVAVARALGERGANMVTIYGSRELKTAYTRAHDGEFETDPDYERALYENADSVLSLRAGRNRSEDAGVPADRRRAFATARKGVNEARLDADWVATVHPTRAMAQQAGMSYADYVDFVYDAVLRDWEVLAEEMAQLKAVLDDGEEVRIVTEPVADGDSAGDGGGPAADGGTDLTMSIGNRTAVNSAASVAYDSHNLPSGEVFTAPVVETVEGTVTFDVPMTVKGQDVHDVRLVFEAGEVVDWSAGQGEAAIRDVLDTDPGARRPGELGIGMNRGIDRPTGQILFDEKLNGTVHLALGRAYEACLSGGETWNDSAAHTDLITDMRRAGTRLEVDGDVIQRDGRFRWEDGFDPRVGPDCKERSIAVPSRDFPTVSTVEKDATDATTDRDFGGSVPISDAVAGAGSGPGCVPVGRRRRRTSSNNDSSSQHNRRHPGTGSSGRPGRHPQHARHLLRRLPVRHPLLSGGV